MLLWSLEHDPIAAVMPQNPPRSQNLQKNTAEIGVRLDNVYPFTLSSTVPPLGTEILLPQASCPMRWKAASIPDQQVCGSERIDILMRVAVLPDCCACLLTAFSTLSFSYPFAINCFTTLASVVSASCPWSGLWGLCVFGISSFDGGMMEPEGLEVANVDSVAKSAIRCFGCIACHVYMMKKSQKELNVLLSAV